jgi:hypothetical protein
VGHEAVLEEGAEDHGVEVEHQAPRLEAVSVETGLHPTILSASLRLQGSAKAARL